MKMIKPFIIIIVISITVNFVGFSEFLKSFPPTHFKTLLSILLLALWGFLGVLMGFKKEKQFLPFISGYFGIGLAACVIGYLLELLFPTILFFIIYIGPLYGITYYITDAPSLLSIVLSIFLVYGVSLLGFVLPSLINNLKKV
ncbi:hypothetical protein [Rossellomorea vietnamensis]|uniref:hypothetical protein n=1 Tax=Rossellomorea vietnamensis TaxID=218284 RepID=UPI001E4A9ED0|nr:hypothetical protein [Rossellomorea vietnamensis]MCC5801875.1 hypothetical protein [Rossellomorea vietnamensis]